MICPLFLDALSREERDARIRDAKKRIQEAERKRQQEKADRLARAKKKRDKSS